MKLSDLKSADAVLAEQLSSRPALRDEWDRMAVARAVAIRLVAYRAEHGLTQTALARQLGMHQSAIARLEIGEHEPTLATLTTLARRLGMRFHIDVTPEALSVAS
jgi:DNA-binding XRE family transcriptional regulator